MRRALARLAGPRRSRGHRARQERRQRPVPALGQGHAGAAGAGAGGAQEVEARAGLRGPAEPLVGPDHVGAGVGAAPSGRQEAGGLQVMVGAARAARQAGLCGGPDPAGGELPAVWEGGIGGGEEQGTYGLLGVQKRPEPAPAVEGAHRSACLCTEHALNVLRGRCKWAGHIPSRVEIRDTILDQAFLRQAYGSCAWHSSDQP
mmetsp:Transcript_16265/g.33963  ORF Transcript_16265/g.33963 Transcript_16265/m.33963 type:complete len:203 (-) Transcript_16265:30-638(-)